MFFRSNKDEPPEEPEEKESVENNEEETYPEDVTDEESALYASENQDGSRGMEDDDPIGKGLRVVIKERNFVTLNYDGEMEDEEHPKNSEGSIKVQNTGSTNPITGIDLKLENVSDLVSETEFSESNHIGVLAPGREHDWHLKYSFSRELQPIKVTQEYYDPENGLSPNFLGGHEKHFEAKIVITNTSEESIYDVKGNKMLNDLATLQESSIGSGEISSNGSSVAFEIDEIEVGSSVEILLKLSASLPDDVPAYESGDLVFTYQHRNQLTSGLVFGGVDGVADFKRRIRRVQRRTTPSFYDCSIVLENMSEFICDLNQFSVFAGNLESKQMLLDWDGADASEAERQIGPSDNRSFEFVYESLEGTPSFGDQIEFSVYSEQLIASETEVTMKGRELRFMAIEISKAFLDENGEEKNEFELPSYVETDVPVKVTLTGVGTYPLEGLEIRDEIPDGFNVKNLDEVVVTRNGNTLNSGNFEVSVGGTKKYEVNDQSDDLQMENTGSVEHTNSRESLIVIFSHLEEAENEGFGEDESITINYTVVADKPEPRDDPIRVQAHAEGFVYEDETARVYAHSELDELKMIVVHLRDDVDISKFISAREVDGKDAYRIELEAENYGTSTVEMHIQDLIPEGFELLEGSIETNPEEGVTYQSPSGAKGGQVHGWTFTDIKPKDTISATFTLLEVDEEANPRKLQSVYKG